MKKNDTHPVTLRHSQVTGRAGQLAALASLKPDCRIA